MMHVLEYFHSVYLCSSHCHLGHYCRVTTMLLILSQFSPITAIRKDSCSKSTIINWVVLALNVDWLIAIVYQTVYYGYDKTCIFTAPITLVTSL